MLFNFKNSYHFSVDDVFDCLMEVADKKIPLFDQQFFKFLKYLHEKFGISVGLHLFYQKNYKGRVRSLKEVPNIKSELINEPWIFFGPHALDYEHAPYNQSPEEQVETFEKIYAQIDRFAGKAAYCKFLRLHFYSESYELAEYFKSKGVKGLFTTDRDNGSHRMPEAVGRQLLEKGAAGFGGMLFIRTQFRVEFFRDEALSQERIFMRIKQAYEKYGFLVFYTHEVNMHRTAGRGMAEMMVGSVRALGLASVKNP